MNKYLLDYLLKFISINKFIQYKKLEIKRKTTANKLIKFKLLKQYQSVEINSLEKIKSPLTQGAFYLNSSRKAFKLLVNDIP